MNGSRFRSFLKQVSVAWAAALVFALVAATVAQAAPGRPAASPGTHRNARTGSPALPRSLQRQIQKTLGPTARTRPGSGSPQQLSGPWAQTAELEASDETAAGLGLSVALSSDGTTALVGAPFRNFSVGAVYVFTQSGGSWSQTAELTASDGAQGDAFGWSVALSGDGTTALVGTPFPNLDKGVAYVFTQSGGSWSQTAELTASDGASFDQFGYSVAISSDGSTALVGGPAHNSDKGAVYVFTQSGGAWSQAAELAASNGAQFDDFGSAVALSPGGTTTLIGAPGGNSDTGAAYVFTQSGGTWSQTAELIASDGASGDHFGSSAALSSDGTTALVGALLKNSETGAAYVFTQSGGSWSQTAELNASDGAPDDGFGISVGLSSDGTAALVGAFVHGSEIGAAYVFTQSGGSWSQTAELNPSDGALDDEFGFSVALSSDGTTALIGAPFHNSSAGAAYVFTKVTQQSTQTALSSSDNPSVVGEQVTYTASVSPVPNGGTVAFSDGGSPISGCAAVPVDTTTGQATCPVTYPVIGSHQITAAYSGDTYFEGSTSSPLTQQVNQASTTTSLDDGGSATFGTPVTLTATVAVNAPGSGTPTGTVTFTDGTVTIGQASLNGQDPDQASITLQLPPGQAPVSAAYGGDENFQGSSSDTQTLDVGCTKTLTGTIGHSVVVSSGEALCLSGTTITRGGVLVRAGGALAVSSGARIVGLVTATSPAGVSICGSTLKGALSISGATGIVALGQASELPSGCGPDTFAGPSVVLSSNTYGLEVAGSHISGSLGLYDNTATATPAGQQTPIEVQGSSIRRYLACSGNSPAPSNDGNPNRVGKKGTGQCAGL